MIKKAKLHRIIRKWHRYLGVSLGIQFLAWTLGGLYFSWTNIDVIRGDNLRKEKSPLPFLQHFAELNKIIHHLQNTQKVEAMDAIQVVNILGKAHYQVIYRSREHKKIQLIDAQTGIFRLPLSEKEAIEVAKNELNKTADVEKVTYLTNTHTHHEYREKPLPAYAVSFGGDLNTTVYVSAELGTVQSLRNNQWRIFDFLWMLHTMDYQNRDDFNNWLLRAFSVFGLLSIFSGFALFFVSLRVKKK